MIASDFLLRPELEKSYQRRSATITAIIVIALLLLAFFLILNRPEPDFPEEGILISMGQTETGSGIEEPQQQQEVTSPPPTPAPQQSDEVVEEVNVTQDVNSTAVDVEEDQEQEQPVEEPEPQEEPVTQPVQTPEQPTEEPQEDPRYTYNPNASNSQSQSTSQGSTNDPTGNMGDPNGDPSSPNMGDNPGLGNSGVAFDLGGRGARSLPTPERKARNEQGKIILEIFVDQQGNVVRVGDLLRGTEVTDPAMIQEARQLAAKCRFQADPSAPSVQRGTIAITFKY